MPFDWNEYLFLYRFYLLDSFIFKNSVDFFAHSFIFFCFVFVFIHRSNWCVFTNRPQLKYANEFQCRKQFIQLSKQIDGWNSSSNAFSKWWKLKQWHKIIQSHFNDFWTYFDITIVAKCVIIFIYAIFLAFGTYHWDMTRNLLEPSIWRFNFTGVTSKIPRLIKSSISFKVSQFKHLAKLC